jgi:hypothetical protein
MSKKVFNLIVGLCGGIATIACALVAFFDPAYAPAIIASIGVAQTAIVEICSKFVKEK